MRRPAFLVRFPRFFWSPSPDQRWSSDWPIIRPEQLSEYPSLADDLAIWKNQLEPSYFRLDHAAQIAQNQFWRRNVALIIGSFVATCLGVTLTAVGAKAGWLTVTQAAFTALLAQLAVLIRLGQARQKYRTDRLKAEWMKSEYFLFLALAGDYAAGDRVSKLRQYVEDIKRAEGST